MPRIDVDDYHDPRLDHYRDLKDRRLAEVHGLFIAEGRKLLERMLDAGYEADSVVVAEPRAQRIAALVPDDVPLYVVPEAVLTRLAGFEIHTGVLATGRRTPWPTLDEIAAAPTVEPPRVLLICPKLKEPANLGAVVRTATALGCDALLLGPECCDPFYRRALRVAMGTTFRLPVRRCDDLRRDMIVLRERFGFTLLATVLDESAPQLRDLAPAEQGRDIAIVLGAEVEGLDDDLAALCDQRVTIPMHLGVDSLNVAVAAAMFVYHFKQPPRPIRLPEADGDRDPGY